MLTMENRSEVMPTLLQGKVSLLSGRMPTLLQGRVSLLTGQVSLLGDGKVSLLGDANFDVATQFRALLQANQSPDATVYISKSNTGSGSGTSGDIPFVVIPLALFGAVNQALMAAGNTAIQPQALTADEQLVPDAGSRFGKVSSLLPIVTDAVNTLSHGLGMPMKTKVILGLGAAALIGGVALIAFGKTHSHKSLAGARRRRRR